MYLKYSQGGKVGYSFSRYIVNDESELEKAPKDCSMGDIVYVIHTSEYWMMDKDKNWYPMSAHKDPINCDCVDEMTIWGEIPENN